MIFYNKLWTLLEKKQMKRTDLLKVISSPTLAKLGKNENVSVEMIGKICDYLNCQPGDIMENISNDDVEATINQLDNAMKDIAKILESKGISKEQFKTMYNEAMTKAMDNMFSDENTMNQIFNEVIQNNMKNQQ